MRCVLDTNVIVAGLRSPKGASAALLGKVLGGQCRIVLSVPLVLEYEAICMLAEHRIESGLHEAQIEMFISTLCGLADEVETHFLWRPQLRDPADEMVLETAVNGHADAIVTFNTRDFGNACERFGLLLLTPQDVLKRIEQ